MTAIQHAAQSLIVAASLAVGAAMAAPPSAPAPADVVRAQGVFAVSQLKVFAAIYGADPTGAASREALDNGWAPVDRGHASPQGGWPARGPSLGESIETLLAQAQAGRSSCSGYEDECQAKALAWARAQAKRVKGAKNPGAELAKVVAGLE